MNPSLNPRDLVDQQFLKITSFLSQKTSGGALLHSPAHSHHSNSSSHGFTRSNSFNAQEKMNLVSNLNTLQLQSNLVPEKFINSPIQGQSPTISRTNTDPSQLKGLIKSLKGEKRNSGTSNPNDCHSQSEVLSNAAEEEGLSLTHADSGSLLHAGSQKADEYDKPQWDPFFTTTPAPKIDNFSFFAKGNNSLNAPPSNFKRANTALKTYTRLPSNQFEEAPQITHTITDPNDLRETFMSFQNQPSMIDTTLDMSTNTMSTKQFADFSYDQLQGNNNYFGPSTIQRINTNTTHLTSLIKSRHFNNSQNMFQPPFENQSISCIDMSLQRSEPTSTVPSSLNSDKIQHISQTEWPIGDSAPNLENIDLQKPITRMNTDPTDSRSLCKPNMNAIAPNFQGNNYSSNLKPFNFEISNPEPAIKRHSYYANNPSYQSNVMQEDYSDLTPFFNPGANVGFDKLSKMALQEPNSMALHRTKTDPTSVRAILKDNTAIRPPQEEFKRLSNDSSYNFSEDGTSMLGLLNKFNNFQLQSPSIMQSELSSEDQVNNDGFIFTKNAEVADNGVSAFQKIDRRPQQQQLYQQYEYLGNNRNIEKPAPAHAFEDPDAWILFPNHANSKSKAFQNLQERQYQSDVDHFLASNTNPIMESKENSAFGGMFDL